MPRPGPPPDPNSVNRNPKADWTDVEDKPFTGKIPVKLPATRLVSTPAGLMPMALEAETGRWFDTITRMPHCILWTDGDWLTALSTSFIADAAYKGNITAFSELRRREDLMGVTSEARRKLRIRYVPATTTTKKPRTRKATGPVASVTNIDERRLRQRQSA